MAQPQPQHPMPQRQFSPPQASPSPVPPQSAYQSPVNALPPNKRPRLSPGPPSQPASPTPYAQSYASPGAPSTPTVTTPAPAPVYPTNQQAPAMPSQSSYTTPYPNGNGNSNGNGNGSTTPTIALPESRPTPPPNGPPVPYTNITFTPPMSATATPVNHQYPQQQQQMQQPQHQQQQQHQQQMQQQHPQQMQQQQQQHQQHLYPQQSPQYAQQQQQQYHPQQQQHQQRMQQPLQQQQQQPQQGAMGPPSRPADRPQKEYEYDVTDSLAGTGIDLRAEEQYLAELYAVDPSVAESRTGFSIHPPGNKASFYGAGSANQAAQPHGGKSQDQVIAEAAEKAWQASARQLSSDRTVELNSAFLVVPNLQSRAESIAKEHGLTLNWDMKASQPMGKIKVMDEHPKPVKVSTKVGPDGAIIKTSGTWIPHDAYLADQLALLSIASKQRLRSLIEDAQRIAVTRQQSSHGEVPDEWKEAAGPLNMAPRAGSNGAGNSVDGAADAGTHPLKRSLSAADSAKSGRPSKLRKVPSANTATVSALMRDIGKAEREWEESRLRRRNARKEGITDAGSGTTRAGSVAPGTPGVSAPDGEKAMTKKEQKKLEAAKKAEASSHANQNTTSREFLGLTNTAGLFGKKKGGKSYSWMTGGGSGASTPKPGAAGKAGAPATPGTPAGPSPSALTTDGSAHRRPGAWREDKDKGKNIQLRDWVSALEGDGAEIKAMQRAYAQLDSSGPKQ
ncbi:hypothetical protein ACHAQA_007328 [Verticillium albo-atrum]